MGKAVDAQVETSLAEAESRGACLHSYSELVHKDLRRRRKLGQVVGPLPGLYARKEYWKGLGPEERAMHKIRGLSRLRPGWVLCGPSAALVLGASVSWSCLDPIEVVSPCGRGSLLGGKVRGRYASEADAYGVNNDGIWTTSPLRTALDCARRLPFRDAVGVVDSLMAKGALLQGGPPLVPRRASRRVSRGGAGAAGGGLCGRAERQRRGVHCPSRHVGAGLCRA